MAQAKNTHLKLNRIIQFKVITFRVKARKKQQKKKEN